MSTLLEGLAGRIPEGMGMEYHAGAPLNHPRAINETWALMMAQSADVAIVCVGLNSMLEGEEGESLLSPLNGDRDSLSLPASQVNYIRELGTAGTPIVLVVSGGSPIDLRPVEEFAAAILFIWYPGMEGGRAVADVLFGDVSPSGKLPVTFPKSLDDLPPFDDYTMAGRTYRYMTAEPHYPFGFGLSYTRFEYAGLSLSRTDIPAGENLTVRVTVANTGARAGAEVAQCYLTDVEASAIVPRTHLVAFERVELRPGEQYVFWGGREGTETDASKSTVDAIKRNREAMNFLCDYVRDQGYDLKFALEAKPNEPRGDIFNATTGHMLAFIETLDHPEMVGVNPEVAHEQMSGLDLCTAWRKHGKPENFSTLI